MTKRELYKFLEQARTDKYNAAKDAWRKQHQDMRDKALGELGYDGMTAKVEKLLSQAVDTYTKWVEQNVGKNGVSARTQGYNCLLNDLYSYTNEKGACFRMFLHSNQVVIETDEIIAAKKAHDAEIGKINANFNAVIATVEGMKTAKEAAQYLKELGFDLSELEEPPTPKMLAKRIDPSFLLVQKESEQKAA